jgi:hypothetical protein
MGEKTRKAETEGLASLIPLEGRLKISNSGAALSRHFLFRSHLRASSHAPGIKNAPPVKPGGTTITDLAEREGFEPPDLLQSTVFKTAAFDRSAISPAQK